MCSREVWDIYIWFDYKQMQFKAMRQDGITKGVVNVDTEEREARAWDLGVERWRRGNNGN